MPPMVVLGIDVGTQSTKAVLCDESMRVLASASAAYGFGAPRPGHAEQDPHDWQRAVIAVVRACLAAAPQQHIAAISVVGQLDGCVPVDADGHASGPCLIWMDRRATLPALPADFTARTGQVADASHMAAKIRYLQAQAPTQSRSGVRFHQPVSFLVEWLCGEAIMDESLASTTMLYEPARSGGRGATAAPHWSQALLDAFAISANVLPRIGKASDVAGVLLPERAAELGLPAGVPVAVGTGDDFATALGAGLRAPGTAVCVLGTAEVVGTCADTFVVDGTLVETHPYPAGGYFVENPGWLSGGALRWLEALVSAPLPVLFAEAATVSPGADGLLFLPALSGAMAPRWNADMRGVFSGLSASHTRGHLLRAMLEAMACAERDVLSQLQAMNLPPSVVATVGGGARSMAWLGIRATITGVPHAPSTMDDACAIGAATLAWCAAGRALADVPVVPLGASVPPSEADRACYDDVYQRYRRLYDAVEPTMPTSASR